MIDPTLPASELGKQGIAAARAGRNDEAREYLIAAVEADERNEQAWLWLGGLMPELEDKIVCLENALTLNPANEPVARKLQQLQLKREMQKPSAPLPSPPLITGWGSTPPAATQDLYLNSPAATQGLPESSVGALPWDHLVTPFSSGETSSLRSPSGDPNPGAILQRPPLGNPEYNAAPYTDYRSGGYGATSNAGNWEQHGTQHMPDHLGYEPAQGADQFVSEYQPGGDSEQQGASDWEQSDSGFHGASSAAWVNPFASAAETNGYQPYDQGNDAPTPIHDPQGYSAATFNPDFNPAPDAFGHDERFDCPYCGWQTRIEDQRCPNCAGELYIYASANEKRSGALVTLMLLWVVRVLRSAFGLGLAIFTEELVKQQIQRESIGLDTATIARYGLSPAAINAATQQRETSIAIYYGVIIGIAVIMAIGSWSRTRIFYRLNLAVIVLTGLTSIIGYLLDPVKSPTNLIVDVVILFAQFLILARAEPDFINQKQRIVEPNYHGEASALGFFNLGTQLQKVGYIALAAKAWRRSVSMAPSDGRTRAALAMAYNRLKRYDLAVEQLTEALKIDPQDTRAMNLMAISQLRAGNYDEARRYVAAALEIKPEDPDTIDNQKLIEDEIKKARDKQPPKPAPPGQQTRNVSG